MINSLPVSTQRGSSIDFSAARFTTGEGGISTMVGVLSLLVTYPLLKGAVPKEMDRPVLLPLTIWALWCALISLSALALKLLTRSWYRAMFSEDLVLAPEGGCTKALLGPLFSWFFTVLLGSFGETLFKTGGAEALRLEKSMILDQSLHVCPLCWCRCVTEYWNSLPSRVWLRNRHVYSSLLYLWPKYYKPWRAGKPPTSNKNAMSSCSCSCCFEKSSMAHSWFQEIPHNHNYSEVHKNVLFSRLFYFSEHL